MSFDLAPVQWPEPLEWCRRIARVVNGAMLGKTNNVISVTLTANAAGTVVQLAEGQLGKDTAIFFDPLHADAAAELYGGTMYVTAANRDAANRRFTITHANTSSQNKTFRVCLVG